jgi:hypothetical protein
VVAVSANVAIVARRAVKKGQTPLLDITDIIGAHVVIVAIKHAGIDTEPILTAVPDGTGVAVVTGTIHRRENTFASLGTGILSARVVVVAHQEQPGHADAFLAGIVDGARVAIGTAPRRRNIGAAAFRQTGVGRTGIVVVAIWCPGALAQTVDATIGGGTCVAVIAGSVCGHERTPFARRTAIGGTDIAVVTDLRLSPHAGTVHAGIHGGARVTIIAGGHIGHVLATRQGITAVVGTRVVVVAEGRYPSQTLSHVTFVSDGAGVTIIAGITRMVGFHRAFAGKGGAHRLGANGLLTFQYRAGDDARLVDLALVRQSRRIAIEGAVTQVTVLKLTAVRVVLTGAIDVIATALPVLADIIDRTRVTIVAPGVIKGGRTSAQPVTGVIGARIAVVASNGQSQADPGLAVVAHGAGIPVLALALIQGCVRATGIGQATVGGTLVTVVTEPDVLPLHEIGFIDFTIAIIVNAVARFSRRGRGITGTESRFPTDPLARTLAKLVGHNTGCRQSQSHRFLGARADPGIGHALFEADPLHGGRFDTRKAPGAIIVLCTRPTAEAPFRTIAQADILGSANALAVGPVTTGSAEIGMARDANEIGIWPCADLLAAPARGALLLADSGADPFTQVLHAPPRLALTVVIALIQETPFSSLAPRVKGLFAHVGRTIKDQDIISGFPHLCSILPRHSPIHEAGAVLALGVTNSDTIGRNNPTGIGTGSQQAKRSNHYCAKISHAIPPDSRSSILHDSGRSRKGYWWPGGTERGTETTFAEQPE